MSTRLCQKVLKQPLYIEAAHLCILQVFDRGFFFSTWWSYVHDDILLGLYIIALDDNEHQVWGEHSCNTIVVTIHGGIHLCPPRPCRDLVD